VDLAIYTYFIGMNISCVYIEKGKKVYGQSEALARDRLTLDIVCYPACGQFIEVWLCKCNQP
jgi:hypothetical protein